MMNIHAVTGAFGYSGRYIAEALLREGSTIIAPAAGSTKLTDWAAAHAATLGLRYTSELARRLDRQEAYQSN